MVNCYRNSQDATFAPQSNCSSARIGGWGRNESPSPKASMAACLGSNVEMKKTYPTIPKI